MHSPDSRHDDGNALAVLVVLAVSYENRNAVSADDAAFRNPVLGHRFCPYAVRHEKHRVLCLLVQT